MKKVLFTSSTLNNYFSGMLNKNVLVFAFCLICGFCRAQIVIDKNLNEANFTKTATDGNLTGMFKTLKSVGIIDDYSQYVGEMIIEKDQADTLNKQEIIKYDMGKTTNRNTTIKEITSKTINANFSASFCRAVLNNIGLAIDFTFGDASDSSYPLRGPYLYLIIKKGMAQGYYYENYSKLDTIYRLKSSGRKTNLLTVPVKLLELKLSTLNFDSKKTIYGEIEYITDSYYVEDSNFKSGQIIKQVHGKYLFTLAPNNR